MIISHLTPRFKPSIGGIETLVYETSKFLINQGNQVKVFTSKLSQKNTQNSPRHEILDGIQIIRSKSFPLIPGKVPTLNIMPHMLFDILSDTSDIYHTYGIGSFPSIVGSLKHKKKNPLVLSPLLYGTTDNMTSQKFIEKLTKGVMKSADKLIAQTKSEKDYLIDLGINESKIDIIPLYANYERFSKFKITSSEFRKKYNLNKNVIMYSGRIESWQKGLDFLVKAVAILKKSFDISCVISGDDWGSKDEIIQLINELKIQDCVKFFDPENQEFLGEAYHASDVLVLPSNFEPFGTVLLEAMCCGTPVIGTDTGGIIDVIKNNHTGLIVPKKNVDALVEAISRILSNENERKKMGENAKLDMKNYSVNVLGKKYLKIYSELMK